MCNRGRAGAVTGDEPPNTQSSIRQVSPDSATLTQDSAATVRFGETLVALPRYGSFPQVSLDSRPRIDAAYTSQPVPRLWVNLPETGAVLGTYTENCGL